MVCNTSCGGSIGHFSSVTINLTATIIPFHNSRRQFAPFQAIEHYQRTVLRPDQFAGHLFPQKLQQLHTQQGLTERTLSQALGVSRAYIYNLEAHCVQPSPDVLALLAKQFAVTASALLDDAVAVEDFAAS